MTGPELAAAYRDLPVAVLGASGFIGRWVVRALARRGARIAEVVRSRASMCADGEHANGATVIEADLTSPGIVDELLARLQPAIVFNLAGYGVDAHERDPQMLYAVNAKLVLDLCASRAWPPSRPWTGVQLVHAGSALEYPTGAIAAERSSGIPASGYGRSKLLATDAIRRAVRDRSFRVAAARLFTVYGPGEHDHRLLPSVFRAATTGLPLPLTSGVQSRDFTYVEDVAEALLCLGASAPQPDPVVNVATGRMTTVREFAEIAARIAGLPGRRLLFGALPVRADESFHPRVSIRRLRRRIGWTPDTPVAVGIQNAYELHRTLAVG